DGYPAQLGEFLKTRMAAEFAVDAVLHAAEGHLRLVVNRGAAEVAGSAFGLFGHAQGAVDVARENSAGKAVGRVVGDAQSVLGIARDDDRFRWAEGFLAIHAHGGRDAEDNRRRVTHAVGFSAGENFRALGDGVVDQLLHALHGAGIDQAAELRIGAKRVADFQRATLGCELFREFLGYGFFNDDALRGHADLTLVHERAEIGGRDGRVEVSIG